jgi:hypothetical protein
VSFRFRRSARLGPFRFHFSKNGLSSISAGGRGASFNVPVNRRGSPRSTVGLPGTGLSWSVEHEADAARGLPNSRRLKPGQLQLLKQECLQILHQELFAPDNDAHRLWSEGLVSQLLLDPRVKGRNAGLLVLIETPEAMQAYIERGRSQDDVKRRAQRCLQAAELAGRLLNL